MEWNVVPLTPAVPPAEPNAGRRPTIQMQGIHILGRHIAQARPMFGAQACESGLWRDIGLSGGDTGSYGGMKPPLQPFAFAAVCMADVNGASLALLKANRPWAPKTA